MMLLPAVFAVERVSAQTPFGAPFAMNAFAPTFSEPPAPPRARVYIPTPRAARNAYCVRTCDGRYFPYPSASGDTDVKVCDAVCPSGDMRIYSGSDIASATSEQDKPYGKLANAFRFQREMVANCTCNARTGLGLTPIAIKDDRTLRTGDIVAESRRLMVAEVIGGSHRRRGHIMFRPLSDATARALGLARASLPGSRSRSRGESLANVPSR
ncbi:MAG: hypothetical protein JWR79_120 [Tardiphaga sp.]|nr:hypothetical protein [Tardiphaga sp.]